MFRGASSAKGDDARNVVAFENPMYDGPRTQHGRQGGGYVDQNAQHLDETALNNSDSVSEDMEERAEQRRLDVQSELALETARQETARSQLAVVEAQARASTAALYPSDSASLTSSTAPTVCHLCPRPSATLHRILLYHTMPCHTIP